MLEATLSQALYGVSYGLLLFMLAAGLTLIFSMMGVLNFAHASFYMLGAYIAYQFSTWFGFWIALVAAPLMLFLLGVLVERWGLRRVHKWGHVPELLFTFGLSYIIVELVQVIWGRAAVPYRVPPELDGPVAWLQASGITFPQYRMFMMAVAVGMLVAIWLLLTRTRIGLVIQAALTHPQQVEALGHNVPRVFMLVFGGGSALAGLAGVVGGNAFVTEPAMAGTVGAIVFVVIVVEIFVIVFFVIDFLPLFPYRLGKEVYIFLGCFGSELFHFSFCFVGYLGHFKGVNVNAKHFR